MLCSGVVLQDGGQDALEPLFGRVTAKMPGQYEAVRQFIEEVRYCGMPTQDFWQSDL